MTPQQIKTIQELRTEGYAIIIWTPEELGDVEPEWVEECSISYASEHLIPDAGCEVDE
jgi:hypothetical protein